MGLAGNLGALGYALVVQDMRGRFASEGHPAIIFGNDGLGGPHKDGHDTIRWITRQPWSDGKVATLGGSALGIVQNMAAPDAPEALKGQVVIMAFSDYRGPSRKPTPFRGRCGSRPRSGQTSTVNSLRNGGNGCSSSQSP
jgi:putative CocE/NonD family hydrolase